MQDYKLSEIKKICSEIRSEKRTCENCPIEMCYDYFSYDWEYPMFWEIDEEITTPNVNFKVGDTVKYKGEENEIIGILTKKDKTLLELGHYLFVNASEVEI